MAAIALYVFWPATRFNFVMFDDDINIYRNEHLGAITLARLKWILTDVDYVRRYIPLGWLTLASVVHCSGFAPSGFHTLNVVLHAVNSGLLVLVLLAGATRLAPSASPAARLVGALVIALWWAVSPLRVEVVAWSSGLLYTASTFWLLVSFAALLRSMQGGASSRLLVGISTVTFACSLLTYPVMLGTAAWILALSMYFFRGYSVGEAFKRSAISNWKWSLLAGVGLAAGVALTTQRASWGVSELARPETMENWRERLALTPVFYAQFIRTTLIPIDLSATPQLLPAPLTSVAFWLGIALAATAIVLGIRYGRTHVGSFWILVCIGALLLPVSPLVASPSFLCHRYTEPLALLLGFAIFIWLLNRSPRVQALTLLTVFCGTLLLLPATAAQLCFWKDTGTLLGSGSQLAPSVRRILVDFSQRHADFEIYYRGNVSAAAKILGNQPGAQAHLQRYRADLSHLQIGGKFVPVTTLDLYRIAEMQDMPQRDYQTAEARYAEACRWCPTFWQAHFRRAFALAHLNRMAASRDEFEKAAALAGPEMPANARAAYLQLTSGSR